MSLRERVDIKPISITDSACHYLTVDETKRPRANSDPSGLHIALANLPEITVTGEDGQETGSSEESELDAFLVPPAPRPRSNTCPDDMFRLRKGRPPTPPPTDIMKSPGGKRFSFNYNTKDLNGISFAHHRLTKVSEDGTDDRGSISKPARAYRRASCLASLAEGNSQTEESDFNISSLRLDERGRLNHSHSTGFLSSFASSEINDSNSCCGTEDGHTNQKKGTMESDSKKNVEINEIVPSAANCSSDSCYSNDNGNEKRGNAPLQAC